jgi:hypothetical protein
MLVSVSNTLCMHIVSSSLCVTAAVCCAGTRAAAGEAQVRSLVSQLEDTNARLDATTVRLSALESTAAEAQQQLLDQGQALAAATALAAAAMERGAAAETALAAVGSDGSGSSSRGSVAANRASSASSTQQALLAESLTKQLSELKLQFGELSATVAAMSRARCVATTFAQKPGQSDSQSVKSEDLDGAGPCPAAGEPPGCAALPLPAHATLGLPVAVVCTVLVCRPLCFEQPQQCTLCWC